MKKELTSLQVRDVPVDFVWRVKLAAAKQKMTLKDFVVHVLQRAIRSEMTQKGGFR